MTNKTLFFSVFLLTFIKLSFSYRCISKSIGLQKFYVKEKKVYSLNALADSSLFELISHEFNDVLGVTNKVGDNYSTAV